MSIEGNCQENLLIIGGKLSRARHLRGEKMTTVASALGMSHAVISQIENGRYYSLKITTLIKLSEYLQVPIAELVND